MRVRFNLSHKFCGSHLLVSGMGTQVRSNLREGRGSNAIVVVRIPSLRTVRFQEMTHGDNVLRGEINLDGWDTLIE